MRGNRSDSLRLSDMLRSIERVDEIREAGYAAFAASWQPQSAVVRELEVIGEAAGAVSEATRSRHPEVEWKRMHGFSSFAKHEYWKVDPERLWRAVEEMPELKRAITRVIGKLN